MAKKEEKAVKDKKSFFKSFKAELKKVIWPTPKQLINNTVAVIVIVLITTAMVFVLDLTFEAINKQGINKIKSAIQSSNTVTDDAEEESQVEEDTTETSDNTVTESDENVEENSQQEQEETNTNNEVN